MPTVKQYEYIYMFINIVKTHTNVNILNMLYLNKLVNH